MVSEKIRELRILNNLTQDDVAQACYVTRSTVANWEAGRRLPDIETIVLLARLFNISVDELLNDEELDIVKCDNYIKQIEKICNKPTLVSVFRGITIIIIIAVAAILVPIKHKQSEYEYWNSKDELVEEIEVEESSYKLNIECDGLVESYNLKKISNYTLSTITNNFKINMNTNEITEAYMADYVNVNFTPNKIDKCKINKAFVTVSYENKTSINSKYYCIRSKINELDCYSNKTTPFISSNGNYSILLFVVHDSYYIGAFLIS